MAGCEFAVLVAEKGCFGGQYGRAGVKRKLLFVKRLAFEDSKQSFLQMKVFWLEKRAAFECI